MSEPLQTFRVHCSTPPGTWNGVPLLHGYFLEDPVAAAVGVVGADLCGSSAAALAATGDGQHAWMNNTTGFTHFGYGRRSFLATGDEAYLEFLVQMDQGVPTQPNGSLYEVGTEITARVLGPNGSVSIQVAVTADNDPLVAAFPSDDADDNLEIVYEVADPIPYAASHSAAGKNAILPHITNGTAVIRFRQNASPSDRIASTRFEIDHCELLATYSYATPDLGGEYRASRTRFE